MPPGIESAPRGGARKPYRRWDAKDMLALLVEAKKNMAIAASKRQVHSPKCHGKCECTLPPEERTVVRDILPNNVPVTDARERARAEERKGRILLK